MKKKNATPWMVLGSIILGIFVGTLTGTEAGIFGVTFFSIYELIGKIFINSLTLVVVPLVSSSIITGIARIGNESSFGRMGLKIFGFYLGTSLLAILIGLFFANIFSPGQGLSQHAVTLSREANSALIETGIPEGTSQSIVSIILQAVPSNIVEAFHGQMLGLIFFSLLFGYALSKIESRAHEILLGFWQGLFQTMLVMTNLIMKCLPLGVFCLVAKTFAMTGLGSLQSLMLFVATVMSGLVVFMFIGLPLLLKLIANVDPWLHLRAMMPALVTAFSTSSSSATLPVTIECMEKRAGVSNKICSLVIPLGTSINMSGSALYECIAALFIAQAYGLHLALSTQFMVVFLALITSIGIAGIPSASIVAIIVILKVIGLPAEGIGLLFAVDRILDMCRTTVNVFSDSCCAVLVACTEGEKKVLTNRSLESIG